MSSFRKRRTAPPPHGPISPPGNPGPRGIVGQDANPILVAASAAQAWHEGQFRKYGSVGPNWGNKVPYIVHPGRVAARISRHPHATVAMVCAAWLHDVIEDCGASSQGIVSAFNGLITPTGNFGTNVAKLVLELTNPSKKFPAMCRDCKKAMDREHLRTVSREAKLIKMADRIDNLLDLYGAPFDFLKIYREESSKLLLAIADGLVVDEELEGEMVDAINSMRDRYGMTEVSVLPYIGHTKKANASPIAFSTNAPPPPVPEEKPA